jgi:hypothetical protein
VVDHPYVAALLRNNTVEIHSLVTQEIVQVISLPHTLEPRWLAACGGNGLVISGGHSEARLELKPVPLLRKASMPSEGEPPRTPTHVQPPPPTGISENVSSKTLVLGRNSIYALCPLTLIAQADALLDKDRVEDAVRLAEQIDVEGVERVSRPV